MSTFGQQTNLGVVAEFEKQVPELYRTFDNFILVILRLNLFVEVIEGRVRFWHSWQVQESHNTFDKLNASCLLDKHPKLWRRKHTLRIKIKGMVHNERYAFMDLLLELLQELLLVAWCCCFSCWSLYFILYI